MIKRNETSKTLLAVFPGTHIPPVKIAPGQNVKLVGEFDLWEPSRMPLTQKGKVKSSKNWQRLHYAK